jgi:hypothetical protein
LPDTSDVARNWSKMAGDALLFNLRNFTASWDVIGNYFGSRVWEGLIETGRVRAECLSSWKSRGPSAYIVERIGGQVPFKLGESGPKCLYRWKSPGPKCLYRGINWGPSAYQVGRIGGRVPIKLEESGAKCLSSWKSRGQVPIKLKENWVPIVRRVGGQVPINWKSQGLSAYIVGRVGAKCLSIGRARA